MLAILVAFTLVVGLAVVTATPASASAPRYDRWQSPAGAVKCRLYLNGSMGYRTIACLIVSQKILVRWAGGGTPHDVKITQATSAQIAQFNGAHRVRYGEVFRMGPRVSNTNKPWIYCTVSSGKGSICQFEGDDPEWLTIRSGRVSICYTPPRTCAVVRY